jgi:hypothetical protein
MMKQEECEKISLGVFEDTIPAFVKMGLRKTMRTSSKISHLCARN